MILDQATTDERLLVILDEYVERRSTGSIAHGDFLADCERRYPDGSIAERLPGLLASLDALHGFAPESECPPANASWESLVAKKIGDFEIQREIGRGGMGIVYEARQISLERIVALKVLPTSATLDQQQIARFIIEAQAAGGLHHPNIVPIYGAGIEEGVHCYSMQLIHGRSLDEFIYDEPPEIPRAIRWTLQAAEAIDHAHRCGVIHRDIKPSNLIVDRDSKVWVTDFGLARCRRTSGGDREGITGSGAVVGTLRYMSPEQAMGNPALVDHRSDIYSIGITLCEMLRGERFSEGDHVHVRRVNPLVSRDIETVLMKSVAAEPGERYLTAGDLAEDLRRVLAARPILARRPSLADRMTKWTLRHRRSVAISAITVLIALMTSLLAMTKFAQQKTALQAALLQSDQNLIAADRNLKQANANFQQTREVLDHFGLMAAERLRGVAGAESLREELVRDLLTYYERFADEVESAAELQNELAQTHLRAAKIIEEVGATRRALAAYERAATILAKLPSSPSNDHEIALCQNSIAILHAQHGKTAKAEAVYQEAIKRLTAINQPATLATVRGNLGLLLTSMNRDKEASREFELATEELSNGKDRGPLETLTAALIWNNLSHLLQADDLEQSLALNYKAIEALRGLTVQVANQKPMQTENTPHENMRALAMSLSNQASLLTRLDRPDDAIAAYQESITHFRELIEIMPMNVHYTEELAITYNNFGRLLYRQAGNEEARHAMTQARNLMQSLARRRPSEPRYLKALASMQQNLERFPK
ncbi:serine/threonine-protein kinase [Allorhodopirellula solitaria]|uniref:Serine/threonine-protein kinase PrkC n=1 Tax=Allorhodopirellula solitaria TaxID=2527987 RepID=A0A5C5XY16_9BACT|nr:serine/threonine-protein kinase [Allorhodopirellula solitaria]TWT67411.1 Serine/threonine-protein kinase PrkC [Allorhodopirellula solitaria]